MKLAIFSLLLMALFAGCSTTTTPKKYNEKHYQTLFCNDLDGVMEYRLPDKTRVDCLTDKYAIEVDFARKWAEGVGQSLLYAEMTGKEPAIGLIMNVKKDDKYLQRLNAVAVKYGIKVFIIEKKGK